MRKRKRNKELWRQLRDGGEDSEEAPRPSKTLKLPVNFYGCLLENAPNPDMITFRRSQQRWRATCIHAVMVVLQVQDPPHVFAPSGQRGQRWEEPRLHLHGVAFSGCEISHRGSLCVTDLSLSRDTGHHHRPPSGPTNPALKWSQPVTALLSKNGSISRKTRAPRRAGQILTTACASLQEGAPASPILLKKKKHPENEKQGTVEPPHSLALSPFCMSLRIFTRIKESKQIITKKKNETKKNARAFIWKGICINLLCSAPSKNTRNAPPGNGSDQMMLLEIKAAHQSPRKKKQRCEWNKACSPCSREQSAQVSWPPTTPHHRGPAPC